MRTLGYTTRQHFTRTRTLVGIRRDVANRECSAWARLSGTSARLASSGTTRRGSRDGDARRRTSRALGRSPPMMDSRTRSPPSRTVHHTHMRTDLTFGPVTDVRSAPEALKNTYIQKAPPVYLTIMIEGMMPKIMVTCGGVIDHARASGTPRRHLSGQSNGRTAGDIDADASTVRTARKEMGGASASALPTLPSMAQGSTSYKPRGKPPQAAWETAHVLEPTRKRLSCTSSCLSPHPPRTA